MVASINTGYRKAHKKNMGRIPAPYIDTQVAQ